MFLTGMAAKEVQKQEFSIGNRDFRVKKLPPLLAKDVFVEHIRPCLQSLGKVNLSSPAVILEILGAIETKHIQEMSKIFLRYCIMCRNDAGQWVKMVTDPEGFAEGMDPAELMVLDARAFAVNFGESVSVFVRELAVITGIDLESILAAQTPSSTLESKQDTTLSEI